MSSPSPSKRNTPPSKLFLANTHTGQHTALTHQAPETASRQHGRAHFNRQTLPHGQSWRTPATTHTSWERWPPLSRVFDPDGVQNREGRCLAHWGKFSRSQSA
ncbi:uncharacterized protein MELLADRAFT_69124 [Melampsora larici-populina 98AG31]|uniref:Uncharacterized protein n=1 Tax=Melampsora larici-populina (strain 98AG31 / pathotype 3-4-7) TaxID=747676 RepID=F4S9H1_MELLP|nr:uncharacterized protein MELLADRAFT_69124 [Melampsora larici-populina 98AG31]EGF98723.1 hypothetical protein MELLADRAFT_69124 [Melampsora larici-populina 98AG31]